MKDFLGLLKREHIVLTAITPGPQKVVRSAQFDSIEDAEKWALEQNKSANVYWTVNVARDVADKLALGRRPSAEDIEGVFAFKMDIDSARPKDTSATEQEKQATMQHVLAPLYQFLKTNLGGPMVVDSGNGFNVLVRLEPLAEPTREFQRTTETLMDFLAAKFDIEDVATLDTSVKDLPRVLAMVGTMKMKGGNTPERPWRPVSLIDAGEPVKLDRFNEFAGEISGLWGDRKIRRWVELLPTFDKFHNGKLALVGYMKKHAKLDEETTLKIVDLFVWLRGSPGWDMTVEKADNRRMVIDTFAKDDENISIEHLTSDEKKLLGDIFIEHKARETMDKFLPQLKTVDVKPELDIPGATPVMVPATTFAAMDKQVSLSKAELTDVGNAQRFADMHRGTIYYIVETNKWVFWDGKRWDTDYSGALVQGLAIASVNRFIQDVAGAVVAVNREDALKWGIASLSEGHIRAIPTLARSMLAINTSKFDQNPFVLNTLSGTIDLRTGELKPHSPDDMLTAMAPVNYDQGAECPRWLAFLREILPNIPLDYIQKWYGYSLTADARERKFQIRQGREGKNGKALALDTLIPTTEGWKTMADIQPGMFVFGRNGKPTRVRFVSEIQLNRPCYSVMFSDGSTIVADAEHLWVTSTYKERRLGTESVKTTEEILSSLKIAGGRDTNHSIKLAAPVQWTEQKLLIEPYTLGAWLGDGNLNGAGIASSDEDAEYIIKRIQSDGYPARKLRAKYIWGLTRGNGTKGQHHEETLHRKLRDIGLLYKEKRVPSEYFITSTQQRQALLEGLMDTDGYCSKQGQVEFCSMSLGLAEDVVRLAHSLGHKPKLLSKRASLYGKDCGIAWRVVWTPMTQVFGLPRKLKRQKLRESSRSSWRYIVNIQPQESVPVKCISVEAPDGIYLAGLACIPTHNTTEKNTVLHVLGDYVMETDIAMFIGRKRDYKGDDMVALRNKRLVFASEPDDSVILNVALLKQVVGRDRIRCRPLHSNTWHEFEARFKIAIITNPRPSIYESSSPIWDRIHLIPYEIRFEGREDLTLDEKLKEEAPGILAWMVQGCLKWQKEGLGTPEPVRKATEAYRAEQDIFGQFVSEFVTTYPKPEGGWIQHAQVYAIYTTWCDREGVEKFGKKRFAQELINRGIKHERRNTGAFYCFGQSNVLT